jgi:hypothetical protein
MSWKIFEKSCPELANPGFESLNRKIAYLATIKKDGSPRLHPVTPFIGEGMLFIFTEQSSPKINDLRSNGRYAMHCTVTREGPLFEFLVMGSAEVVEDPDVWLQAVRIANSPVVTDGYVLFEFHVDRVLSVEYDENGNPLPHRWKRNDVASK